MPDKTDAKTLLEILEKLRAITPYLDDKVEDILRRYPDLATPAPYKEGAPVVRELQLGRVVAIAITDFLCWAYDRPEKGYIPPERRER